MIEPTDWRLNNQAQYLTGAVLVWNRYAPANPDNDHDHCEFCWTKFMREGVHETLAEGYSTPDRYRWICEPCFADFQARFGWQVDASSGSG